MESRAATYSSASTVLIDSRTPWIPLDFRELLRYRELLLIFVWRDIKVRYKQTALGVLWILLQPVVSMVVFSGLFGLLLKVPSGSVPYPLFTFAALVPWQYFSGALTRSSGSLISNTNLITKVYFPRLIIPLSSIGISGSLLIETIFSLDGLGLLGFESVLNRDYPVVFGTLFIFSLVGLVINLISDLTYMWIDPRIDFEAREVR